MPRLSRTPWIAKLTWLLVAPLAFLAPVGAQCQEPIGADLPPAAMWGQSIFVIPYRWSEGADPAAAREVILYRSADRGVNWEAVANAEPNVRAFTYHAERDAEYCFAVRTVDKNGDAWPQGELKPELRVIVDTRRPRFSRLTGQVSEDGRLMVECKVEDEHLDASSLRLMAQFSRDEEWVALQSSPAPVDRPNVFSIKASAAVPLGRAPVLIRASVADGAGNFAESGAVLERTSAIAATSNGAGETANAPQLSLTSSSGQTRSSQAPNAPAAGIWRAAGDASPAQVASPAPEAIASQAWPADNQSALARSAPVAAPAAAAAAANRNMVENPFAASPFHQVSTPTTAPAAMPTQSPPAQPPLAPRPGQRHDVDRFINLQQFSLEYGVESVGAWGIERVELWGTVDGGQSWRRMAIDTDGRSPVDVTVPGPGLYGFRVVVESVGGLDAPTPQPGDPPELLIEVDTAAPIARLLSVKQGEGYFGDHLEISWQAEDPFLEPHPIALSYSSHPNGPWTPIATNLANGGTYSWRLQRHIPQRVYVRLEARDRSGNVGQAVTEQPVAIRLPEAAGYLRGVNEPAR